MTLVNDPRRGSFVAKLTIKRCLSGIFGYAYRLCLKDRVDHFGTILDLCHFKNCLG